MKDFYRQYDAWSLGPLRSDLPAYVYYCNSVRRHRALGSLPSITRLQAARMAGLQSSHLSQGQRIGRVYQPHFLATHLVFVCGMMCQR